MVRVASPTFVGRGAELAALDEALDAAAEGRTTTVLISGDPGVGKTRLLETWNPRARERGARIAVGSCLDLGETGPAYTAVVEALREVLRGLDPGEEEALVGSDRSVLARIVPELGRPSDIDPSGSQAATFAQTRLFDRLVDVLQRASTNAPLVLELEDIHWADQSSQAFLLYLVEMAREANLLLIGTYRPEVAETDRAFGTTLGQLLRRPRVATLPVHPFDEGELREQLTGILGAPPSNSLLAAIRDRSEGNALFAEELLAAHPKLDLPGSVGAATAFKVSVMSPDARSVLRVTAVVGREAGYEVIREVTALSDGELAAALRECVEARLLEPVHVGEAYRFRHALIQEAIYQETLPGERRQLHSAVAHALADDPDAPPEDPDLAPRLAQHWYEAREFDRAFRASRSAAHAAQQQAAYAASLRQYERMLEIRERAASATADDSLAGIHERAARSAFLAGELEAAARHGRQALADLEADPDASIELRVRDQLAATLQALGQDADDVSRPVAAMELGDRPIPERVVILLHRSIVLREEGAFDAAFEMAKPLPEMARSTGDPALEARAATLVADLGYMHDPDGSLRGFAAARDLAERAGDLVLAGDIDGLRCEVLLYQQRYDELLEASTSAVAFAERVGIWRLATPFALYHRACAQVNLGMLEESLATVREALRDEPTGVGLVQIHLVGAQASMAAGALEDAHDHLQASLIPDRTEQEELGRGWLATLRAQLALAQGQPSETLRIVATTAPRIANAEVMTEMGETIWWLAEVGLAAAADRADWARAAGDKDQLRAMFDVAEELTADVERIRRLREAGGMPDLGTMDGHDALIAGHVARIEGRDDPAAWAAAAGLFPPRSVEALTARYRQSEAMLAARAPREEVRAVMASAHAAAVDIGARPLASRFEELARRARIDLTMPPSAGEAPTQTPPEDEPPSPGEAALRARGLSAREVEVLKLVAGGYANADIAERLFISTKTASVHVSHILDKLDVSTRTEAATIGVRLGLPEVDAN